MMLPSRLDCPLSLKTPNMGNPGPIHARQVARLRRIIAAVRGLAKGSDFGTMTPLRNSLRRIFSYEREMDVSYRVLRFDKSGNLRDIG